ncbi:NADH-quinone oxidoreductase subunit L [candidate division KSB1 bacterium]
MDYLGLILLFPLLGVIFNGFFGKKSGDRVVSFIGPSVIGLSFLFAALAFLELLQHDPENRRLEQTLFTWISSGDLNVSFTLLYDQLSGVMALVVTGISFLIHIYSTGYMHGDKSYARYFTYLNLFVFMMLLLVLGNNYLVMFIGWEGVGLCSYLLIGFWWGDRARSDAGRKAFIVNRIGDFGFLLGMFLLFKEFGSLFYSNVFAEAAHISTVAEEPVLIGITLLLFVGAIGKSAQIPLYVWLPDAMAGPTPVSALIHAATMVTAGVYMVARSSVLYALAPTSMMIVAVVGALTALFAATIGIAQNDIKKVLAYSTVSQLGYMFIAVGVGAFSAGIFHLMTHAFFKALLFLGAGSVIHAMHHVYHESHNENDPQDMRNMGGLRKHMPTTYFCILTATLTIAGMPLFSGFFSKDEILWFAFASPRGGLGFWLIGALAAGITAFYMFRLLFMTFFGETQLTQGEERHMRESPKNITIPLIILAVLSVGGGWIGIPASLGGANQFEHFLEPVFADAHHIIEQSGEMAHGQIEYILMGVAVFIAAFGFYIAYRLYVREPELPERVAERAGSVYRIVHNKYYVDEFYDAVVVRPFFWLSDLFWKFFDVIVVDGTVDGTGWVFRRGSQILRKVQSGYVQEYIVIFVLGGILIFAFVVFR